MNKLSKIDNNHFTAKLLDAFTNEEAVEDESKLTTVYLVMEYIKCDLSQVLDDKHLALTAAQLKTLIYNLLLAMKFLHSTGIVHRDIKPCNILITEDCTVKLCDFGFARSIKGEESEQKEEKSLTPLCFTRWYRPPEILL